MGRRRREKFSLLLLSDNLGKVMKKQISWKHALHFCSHILKQHIVREIITIILLASSCVAFGVCSSTFIVNYMGKQAELFRAYDGNTVAFSSFDWSSTTGGSVSESAAKFIYQSDIDDLITRIGQPYGKIFSKESYNWNYGALSGGDSYGTSYEWFYADYDRQKEAEAYNQALIAGKNTNGYQENYISRHFSDCNNHLISTDGEMVTQAFCYLPENELEKFGCTLSAGEMPTAVDEIAINECWLAEFMQRGYYLYDDILTGELVQPVYNGIEETDTTKPNGYILNIEDIPSVDSKNIEKINSAADMIGKRIALYGVIDEGRPDGQESNEFYLATITGVVNTGCGYEYRQKHSEQTIFEVKDKIFVSDKWVENFYGDWGAFAVVFPRPTDRSGIIRFLEIEQETLDRFYQPDGEETSSKYMIAIAGENNLLQLMQTMKTDFVQIQLLFLALGIFCGIFSILLCANLISVSMEDNRYNLGVLKSMGASDRDFNRIFLLECLLIGILVFCLTVGGTVGVVYGLIGGYEFNGVYLMEVGFLQIILLLCLCIAIPLIVGWIKLRWLSRYTAIELISENFNRKRRRKKNV